ncbi:MAG: hypothetical protein PSX37_07285, partial [bacterium]|nr:hypothetical protein [bacterium]
MPVWDEIIAAVGLLLNGDRTAGRGQLLDCWEATAAADHAERCVLAHYLADTESELDAEIAWDEQALAEYSHVGETDLSSIGIPSALAMAPSLHLNLGDGYLRAGRVEEARAQADRGTAAAA